jgi:hypothetical protein
MSAHTTDTVIFVLIVGARFLVPLLIPRFPLPAILACLVIDAADQTIFANRTNIDLANYQSYDKALDIYYLTIAYLSAVRNWQNGFALEVARFLWYYRLVGVVLFELIGNRAILFIFPNTFEYFFIAYEAIRVAWDPRRLSRRTVVLLAAGIWIFVKLPQEWWIHIAQLDFTDFMHETVFGVDPSASWGDAIANRPGVAVALVAAIVALAVLAAVMWRRRPPQDWTVRFDVDRPVPAIVLPAGDRTVVPMAHPTFEKVALIALVATIFGQMLQIGASSLQVLAATAIVVVVNAGLSTWLGRRGIEWRSVAIEFATLAVVNTIVLSVFTRLVADGRTNRAGALFFGLLLTLIITMYDRYRAIHTDRLVLTHEATAPLA